MLPPACASTRIPPALISCVLHGDAVSVLSLPPSSPRASRPPPSQIPTLCCFRFSTPRCRPPFPPVRLCGSPPCLLHCLPVHRGGPVSCNPPLPLSSPVLSLFYRATLLQRPSSGLPPQFRPSPPPAGPCGRLPLPLYSCRQLLPPIWLVRTNILEIRQAGLLRLDRWQAGPCPMGKSPVGLA